MKKQKEGTLFNKDKTRKVEFIKIGNQFHFTIYQLVVDKLSRRYEKMNKQEASMTETQFKNYLYTELYIDYN